MLVKRIYWHFIPLISLPPLSITDFVWSVSQLIISKEKTNVQITSLLKPWCIYFIFFFINAERNSVIAPVLYIYITEIIFFVVADFAGYVCFKKLN